MKDGRFEEDDPVICPKCEWTGRFQEAESAPCPGGVTHQCPGCGDRGRLALTQEWMLDETRTEQSTLGDTTE